MGKTPPLTSIATRTVGRDMVHEWANLIVGFNLPRSFVRGLTKRRFEVLVEFIMNQWLGANDNIVPKMKRPRWLPKRHL